MIWPVGCNRACVIKSGHIGSWWPPTLTLSDIIKDIFVTFNARERKRNLNGYDAWYDASNQAPEFPLFLVSYLVISSAVWSSKSTNWKVVYDNFGARSRHLGHTLVNTSHSTPWEVITYPCLIYLLLKPKSTLIPILFILISWRLKPFVYFKQGCVILSKFYVHTHKWFLLANEVTDYLLYLYSN